MNRVRNPNDLFAGGLLILLALLALWLIRNLAIGTASSMGPGYLPRLLCVIQIALGAAIALQGFVAGGDSLEAWFPRPLLWVLAGIAFFGLAVERAGLVIAVAGLVVLSSFAHRATRLFAEAVPLALALAGFSVLVFVIGLRLPMLIVPQLLVR